MTSPWLAGSYLLVLSALSLWLAVAACVAFGRERIGLGLAAAIFSIPGLLHLLASVAELLN